MDEDTSTFLKSVIAGFIRHLATTAAGALVTYGVVGNDQRAQAVGAIAFILGAGWSYAEKHIRLLRSNGNGGH